MIPIFSMGFIQVATRRVGVGASHTFGAVSTTVTTLHYTQADAHMKAGENHPLKFTTPPQTDRR